ncbi:oxidative damage protection protein [Thioflexithrix psekupsensis]|uniref:Probable Fe(2+)-trafficking protein n=1 Tax=Thioflexithrix psekupsensis TaxID=1570016 RepID=A0A251XBH8_9GAMM|nr:oxidative damage protection protein [Thioflexithrix psekupsensis]OUD15426.1 oxidative damage protection protein [Thioflexithrix psekupsensis]
MTRMVNCAKLGRQAEGLKAPPYPGELGKRIYLEISNEAWQMWLKQQTMLINEYRLTPVNPDARKLLETEMEKFLFGAGSQQPQGYVPPKTSE